MGIPPAKALEALAPWVEWAKNKLVYIPELTKTKNFFRPADYSGRHP